MVPGAPSLTPPDAGSGQLRHGSLTLIGSLGQSVANIAPTFTPALNVAVVAGMAGTGSWLSYLIATVGMLFVGACIAPLARRHAMSGSYFIYVGRTFGPLAGMAAGWAMVCAYVFAGAAVVLSMSIFLDNLLTALGLGGSTPPSWLVTAVLMAGVLLAAYRDIRVSSRIGLALEGVSVAMVVVIIAIVAARHGTLADPAQAPSRIRFGPVLSSLTFAVFSFVGFESAATLAKETRDPERSVPLAVLVSAATVGVFFTATTYLMVLGAGDDTGMLAGSGSPFADMTKAAGLPRAAAVVYFAATISAVACALACVNALSRTMFSMGRFGFLHGGLGLIHRRHGTPHVAVAVAAGLIAAASLAVTPLGLLDAFGTTGTVATFGFLLVYLLIAVASPVDLRRAGLMRPRHVATGAVGAILMAFVIAGSVYPVPAPPYDVLPYLFAVYMLLGLGWYAVMSRRGLDRVAAMGGDKEA